MTAITSRRRLVSPNAVAERADISVKTVRRRIADGTLPAYRVGRLVKVDERDIDLLMRPIPTVGGERVA